MSRRLSQPAGPRASIPEKIAEAVCERVEISSEKSLASLVRTRSGALREVLGERPFMMVAARFALGFMTAPLLHGRR